MSHLDKSVIQGAIPHTGSGGSISHTGGHGNSVNTTLRRELQKEDFKEITGQDYEE